MLKKILVSSLFATLFSACGPHSSSQLNEAWNEANDPRIMGIEKLKDEYQYETKFDQLSLESNLPVTPWSDYYWPTYLGGLSYRWSWQGQTNGHFVTDEDRYNYQTVKFNKLTPEAIKHLSPAEKYDLYMGFEDYRTTQQERQRTQVLKRVPAHPDYDAAAEPIPHWEGLCHAWAHATLAFQEPELVTMTNKKGIEIPFGSSDIKGLLSLFLDHVPSPDTRFLGGRCSDDMSSLLDKIAKIESPEEGSPYFNATAEEKAAALAPIKDELARLSQSMVCRDTNAGAFHLVITNQIAKLQEGFIVDVTRDDEVWNHPVYGFKSEVVAELEPSTGAAPGTVKEIEVLTRMDYIVEVSQHWQRKDYRPEVAQASVEYHYRLELNANGEIIGGEWLDYDRPDFIWKQSTPKFKGTFKGVGRIYRASIQRVDPQ
jgi:hypothetical protein